MKDKKRIVFSENQLLDESKKVEEEYNQILIDLCKEIEKGPSKNITKEFIEMTKRLGIR